MAATGEKELAVVKDLDSLAVQFGQSLLESDLKAYNDESSDTGNYVVKLENTDESTDDSRRTDFKNLKFDDDPVFTPKRENISLLPNTSPQIDIKQKIYRCEDCGQSYNKSSSFSNHRLAHHPSVCTHCGRRFSMPSSLESHLQLECGRRKDVTAFECHICHKFMSTKKILNRHLRLHSTSGNHACKVCSKSFGLKSSLEFHMRTHDNNKPFRCKVCFTTFTEKSTAIRHVKKQHSPTDYNTFIENNLKPASPIELANQITFDVKLFGAASNDNSPQIISPKLETPQKGEIVQNSSPSLKSLLEQPMAKMLDSENELGKKLEDTLNESQCNIKIDEDAYETFDNADSEDEDDEVNTQQGDYFKVYNCKLCDKSYHHSSSLNKHMKKHDSSKFVTCYICKKVCVNEEDFQAHFTLHSSTKTYTCPLCGAKIARRSSVLRHIRKTHKYPNEGARDLLNRHLASLDTSSDVGLDASEVALDTSEGGLDGSETATSEPDAMHEDSLDDLDVTEPEVTPEIDEPEPVVEPVEEKKEVNQVEEFEHFTCNVCEQIFLEKAKLAIHLLSVHKLSEEEALVSSGLRINEDEKEVDKINHFTCSLCKQIFLEKNEWKKHLCELHGLSNEEADSCIEVESEDHVDQSIPATADESIKPQTNEINARIFDTTLSVTVEKDNEGVQKVIKVMPEVGSATPGSKMDSNFKPYSCSMCGTRFVEKSSVRRHLKRTHKFSPEEAREYMIRADYTKEPTVTNKIIPIQTSTPLKSEGNDSLLDSTENDSSYMDDEDKEDQSNPCQRTFLCSLCKRRFMLRSSVRRHLRKVHHFTPEEARECDILAEENKDQVFKIRKPVDNENNVLNDTCTPTVQTSLTTVQKQKQKTDISCKICKQKFTQRFGLKRHLINVHKLESQEVETYMEEQMNEVAPSVSQTCSLCFTIFESRPKLRVHLMKLHRLAEPVADRILLGAEMSDYTEGIEHDVVHSGTDMDVSESLDDAVVEPEDAQMYINHEDEDAENFDIDDDSNEMKLGNSSDVMFGLKGEKDLLAEMNFETINPWGGSDLKQEGIETDNLEINETGPNAEMDFSLAEDDKLMETSDGQDPMNIGLLSQDNENDTENKTDNTSKVGSLSNTSAGLPSYLQKRSYDCPICGRVMSDASARSKHIRRHEGRAGFKCGLCDKIFPQLRLIESHLKTHSGFGVKCGMCFIYCAERHGAKRHIQRIHNIEANTEQSEKNILVCTLDAPNIQDNMNNYTVIDLSKQTDIVEIVPNTLLGRKSDIEKWRLETAEAKAKEKIELLKGILNETDDISNVKTEDNVENILLDSAGNQSTDQYCSGDSQGSTEINKDGCIKTVNGSNIHVPKKVTKIDSVISSLHKKLLTKNINGSDTDDQSDTGSPTETDSPKSVYSAENFSPLKIKLTKKFAVEKSPKNTMQSVANAIDDNDDHGSETDNTVDIDYESASETNEDFSNLLLAENTKTEPIHDTEIINTDDKPAHEQIEKDVALLDQELIRALMPEFTNGGTMGNLDSLEITLKSLKDTEKEESLKPLPHLICWECGKTYSNYKSYREHRRKKHPLSCNICRQVYF